jgi:hypothetical protein
MSILTDPRPRLSPELELERIVPLSEATRLSSVSEDTLLRHHRDKLVRMSPRRYGIRIRDALFLSRSPPSRF